MGVRSTRAPPPVLSCPVPGTPRAAPALGCAALGPGVGPVASCDRKPWSWCAVAEVREEGGGGRGGMSRMRSRGTEQNRVRMMGGEGREQPCRRDKQG